MPWKQGELSHVCAHCCLGLKGVNESSWVISTRYVTLPMNLCFPYF